MLHRGIKFVHAAALAFSAVVAFLFLRGLDEDFVLGHSALVWVSDSNDAVSGDKVAESVASFAKNRSVTVVRELPDLRNPDGRRHLYLAPGGPGADAASWLKDGYPAFSRGYHTDVHPIAEVGQRDPRGVYYIFGSAEDTKALVAEFTGLGLIADANRPLSFSQLAPFYADSALYWSFWVVALASVAMTGASVLLNAKAYGVLRLQGQSFNEILVRDLRQLGMFWLIAAGAAAAAAVAFLAFYNGMAWLSLFVSVTAGIASLLIALMLAAHAGALALTFKTDVLRALKGELPARLASACAYLVRIPALLLALSIATSVVLAGQDVLARQDSRGAYAKAGDAAAIRLNGSVVSENSRMEAQVGQWLRQNDAEGKVIVAGRRELMNIAPPGSGLPQGELLIVNETFLAEQPFFDTAGKRYLPTTQSGKASGIPSVRLIVPEALAGHAPVIAARVPGLLRPGHSELIRPNQVETRQAKSGQRVFSYNPGGQSHTAARNPKEDRSLVRDPVLLVIPNGSDFLTDNAYTAFATQGGVVFPDPDDVRDGIAAKRLQTYVTAIRPIGQYSALQLRDAVNDFRLQIFNLAVAVVVLLITGVGVCIVYSRKNAQAIFVKHISGWRFVATHRTILAVEAMLALLLAAWGPFNVWQQNQELEELAALGMPPSHPPAQMVTALDVGVAAGLVAFEVVAVLLALAVFHRRIVREGATEA